MNLDVSIGGKLYLVNIKESLKNEKLEQQKKVAKAVINYIEMNPTASISLLSIYISYCGLNLLWFKFKSEDIELFDYISITDLFFGFFSVSYAPISIIAILLLVAGGFKSYQKVPWKTGVNGFWFIALIYIVFTPVTVAFVHLKILELDAVNECASDQVSYEVTYSHPSKKIESELYLIASLSDFKIFSRSKRGCNTPAKKNEKLNDIHILAVNSNSILTMEHKLVN